MRTPPIGSPERVVTVMAQRTGDTRPMSDRPVDPPRDAVNRLTVGPAENVVQSGTITGGVHFHGSRRPMVELPYRAGTVPLRATAFQHRETTDLLAQVLASGDAAVLTSDS